MSSPVMARQEMSNGRGYNLSKRSSSTEENHKNLRNATSPANNRSYFYPRNFTRCVSVLL